MEGNSPYIIETSIGEMEKIQAHIGNVQLNLLQILTDGHNDKWDDIAQNSLIQLERLQRGIGEAQVDLVQQLDACDILVEHESTSKLAEQDLGTRPKLKQKPKLINPKLWLENRGFVITPREACGLDEAENRAALFLGNHYRSLKDFYDSIKQTVARQKRNKWLSVEGLAEEKLVKLLKFGNMLKDSSFLSEFRYVRKDKKVFFIPLDDGRVTNFITGGWFERYILQCIQQRYHEITGARNNAATLHGAKVEMPNGRKTEFDLLIGISDKIILWIECKTGDFQNYVTRLREINQHFLNLPANQAALVLLEPLASGNKASASELSGMSVMHCSELSEWFDSAMEKAD